MIEFLSQCPIVALARYKAILLQTCPEHHIRFPGKAKPSNAMAGRSPFPFLKLDIISHDDMGKQRLDFIGREESSGADIK